MRPTKEQFEALEKLYDYFNEILFERSLPAVMLTVSRGKKFHGFFAPERWDSEGNRIHEIALNPETMNRPFNLVCSTLVHEMVHLWQQVYGIKKPRKAYHNKEWANYMEKIGLIPSSNGLPGGARTGQHMTHYIQIDGPFEKAFNELYEDYYLPLKALSHMEPDKKKAKAKNKIKYSCPGCDVNVWGAPDLNIRCNDCVLDLKPEENEGD